MVKLGLIAAASAAAGGFAATKLRLETVKIIHENGEFKQNPDLHNPNADFGLGAKKFCESAFGLDRLSHK